MIVSKEHKGNNHRGIITPAGQHIECQVEGATGRKKRQVKAAGRLCKMRQEGPAQEVALLGDREGRAELRHPRMAECCRWETGQGLPGENKVTFQRNSKKTGVTALDRGLRCWKNFSFRY